jgi:hypothetical protein
VDQAAGDLETTAAAGDGMSGGDSYQTRAGQQFRRSSQRRSGDDRSNCGRSRQQQIT